MFDRFTDRARQAMSMSRKQMIRLGHGAISDTHIFLGLLEADGRAAWVLRKQGIDAEKAIAAVDRRVPRGEGPEDTSHTPFTPAARKALEASLIEAVRMGFKHLGTEHILLGLLRIQSPALESILDDLRLDRERVLPDILALDEPPPPR